MLRSVAISGGSTSNFFGAESVAAREGRKTRFIENKNFSFRSHVTMPVFFGKQ
jgi:hypothetical protein